MRVLSIDQGFGDVKYGYSVDGVIKEYQKETNAIVKLGNDSESALKYSGSEKNLIKRDGNYYLVGGQALQYPDSKVINVTDYEALKDIAPLIFTKYINKYGGNVDQIVATISVAYLKYSGEYKQWLAEKLPFPIEKIKVIPQGPAAKVALDYLGLTPDNPSVHSTVKNFLGVDIGFNTVDVFLVVDGSVMPADVQGYAGMGVMKIANKVVEHSKQIGHPISISRARQVIYDKRLVVRGETFDFTKVIDEAIDDYIRDLKNFLEEKYSDAMTSISNLILFGGGAEVIRSRQDVWYTMYKKDFVLIPESGAEYYNMFGGLFV